MEIILKRPPKIPWRNNNLSLVHLEPPLSEQGETLIGVYLLILGWLSWLGNSVVIFVLYRQRTSLLPTDFLTLNLAVSDASISVFGYSRGVLEIFNVFRDDGFLITWIWTCQVDGFLTLLFGLASINTLTVISVTRYIKGCHPNKAHCIRMSTILISVMFIWSGALFWSMAPLLGWGSYTDRGYGTCEVDWSKAHHSTISKSYIMSILISCFLVPVLVMLFSYVSIINTVKSSNAMCADGYLNSRQRKLERDVTRVSIAICTAFVLAWSPYAVLSLCSALGVYVPNTSSVFTRLLAKSASFYNPLIYLGMSAKFRRDVVMLLPCARDSRDLVHLQNFKNLDPKAEADADARPPGTASPLAPSQIKTSMGVVLRPVPDDDSGVSSPSHTLPLAGQEPGHSRVAGPDWESHRL
ncbi:opsin-5-like [Osmerus eperlanus]|uniref:opsin-5-like n=1 Tax=Osmerus eperlanus TaxID=29151 RepID=UPI002E1636F4